MRHPPPHRLADAAAGRLSPRRAARVSAHLAACEACAASGRRLARLRGAMDEVRDQPGPELGWDHIGARIYWVTSSEKRAAERRPAVRRWQLAALGAGAAVALGLGGFGLWQRSGRPALLGPDLGPRLLATAPREQILPVELHHLVGLRGVTTFAEGEVRVDGAPVDLERPLEAGAVIETGEGRVAVQFGPDSGFELGPRSRLVLTSFDEGAIDLGLSGTIDVEVAKRLPGQTFAVTAGRRSVVVRGTIFRVARDGDALGVRCTRGKVAVVEGQAEVEVAAGYQLDLVAAALLGGAQARPLAEGELAELDRSLAMPLLPAWTDPAALYATSGTLAVPAAPGHPIKVDGVEVGDGGFIVRVMSGRHHLEQDGEVSWAVAAPGARTEAHLDRAGDGAGRKTRRSQLAQRLDGNRRARGCLDPLAKQGLIEGSFVTFDIGVNPDGSLGHLNVVESNLPPRLERCLRMVVDDVDLPAGPEATVRYKLAF